MSTKPTKPADPTADVIQGVAVPRPGRVKQEHGAQNHLTGAARAAARGAVHGDIMSNVMARDAAVAAGLAGDGSTPDGSTIDGRQQPDVIDGADQATFSAPGKAKGDPARVAKTS